jgi:hypothetical protein
MKKIMQKTLGLILTLLIIMSAGSEVLAALIPENPAAPNQQEDAFRYMYDADARILQSLDQLALQMRHNPIYAESAIRHTDGAMREESANTRGQDISKAAEELTRNSEAIKSLVRAGLSNSIESLNISEKLLDDAVTIRDEHYESRFIVQYKESNSQSLTRHTALRGARAERLPDSGKGRLEVITLWISPPE